MGSRLLFWKPGNIDNTYCRNRLHLFDACSLIFLRKQVENRLMDADISIEISPSHAQLRKLTQCWIWMAGIDIFGIRIRRTLSIGTLQFTLQNGISRFSRTHSHILVAINLAQRVEFRLSCYKLTFELCSRIHRGARLLFDVNSGVSAGEVA